MTPDLDLLRDCAKAAGRLALELREKGLEIWSKPGGSPVTNADMAVDAMVKQSLRGARSDYGWLSEETADDPARLDAKRLFIVDPIDGTRSFMKGGDWWVVALAVVEDGQPTAAVIHAPVQDETYEATEGGGARLNGEPIHASATKALENCAMLAEAALFNRRTWATPWPAMQLTSRNAIAYRMALTAAGAYDAAVALGPKADWDICAGALICREAGALATDHKGGRLVFNTPHARNPSLICAAPGVHPLILDRTRPIDLPDDRP